MGEDARATHAGELLAQRLDAHPERDGIILRLTSADGARRGRRGARSRGAA